MDNPKTAKGALHWGLLGLGSTVLLLLVAQFFPSIIPASAKGQTL